VLWAALATSAFVAVPTRLWWARILLLAVGVGVTIHILRIRTRQSLPRTPVGLSASSGSRGPE
jgi:hypothetical protein